MDFRVRGHDYHATSTVYVHSRVYNTLFGPSAVQIAHYALTKGLNALDAGDTLIAWKLDKLGRSRRVKMGHKPKLLPQQVAYARKLLEQGKDLLALMYQAALA